MKIKKIVIILCIFCFPLQFCQQAVANKKKGVASKLETIVINIYGESPSFQVTEEYASHPLGNEVARRWHVIESVFLQRSNVTVGFGYNNIEIQKPQIYNSLCKINSFYKKEVAAGKVPVETAQEVFCKILAIAYDLYFYEDSNMIENSLKELRTAPEKIAFFNAIIVNRV